MHHQLRSRHQAAPACPCIVRVEPLRLHIPHFYCFDLSWGRTSFLVWHFACCQHNSVRSGFRVHPFSGHHPCPYASFGGKWGAQHTRRGHTVHNLIGRQARGGLGRGIVPQHDVRYCHVPHTVLLGSFRVLADSPLKGQHRPLSQTIGLGVAEVVRWSMNRLESRASNAPRNSPPPSDTTSSTTAVAANHPLQKHPGNTG